MENNRGESYPVNQDLFNTLILDLLIEIRSDQLAYHKLFAEQVAGKYQWELNTIQELMESQKQTARNALVLSLYSEYGDLYPDIKDILK